MNYYWNPIWVSKNEEKSLRLLLDQAEKSLDKNHQRKEQRNVRLRPSQFIVAKINPNYTHSTYLYPIEKGAPLPSYQRRTKAGPSSHQLRGSFFR